MARQIVILHAFTEAMPIGNLQQVVLQKLKDYLLSPTSKIEVFIMEGNPTFCTEVPHGWQDPTERPPAAT